MDRTTGFTVLGPNSRFLLADFTVTHNTASFCIPVLEKVDTAPIARRRSCWCRPANWPYKLERDAKALGKHLSGTECDRSTGGTELKEDIIRLMKPVHIIVATPGRILDLANKRVANFGQCQAVRDG